MKKPKKGKKRPSPRKPRKRTGTGGRRPAVTVARPADRLARERALLAAGKLDEARAALEARLEARAEDDGARDLLARVLMQAKAYDEAAAHYRTLGRPDAEALALVLAGRLDEARALAEQHSLRDAVRRAIEVAPHTTEYRLRAIRDLMDAGRWREALTAIEDLIGDRKDEPPEEIISLRRTCRERLGLE